MQEHNLRKTFLAQKKEIQAVEKNKSLKLKNELVKLKNSKTSGQGQFKLENKKLKETVKSMKILHKDQLSMKDSRITEQNWIIKILKSRVNTLEKSLEKLNNKSTDFQRKSATNIARRSLSKSKIREKDLMM